MSQEGMMSTFGVAFVLLGASLAGLVLLPGGAAEPAHGAPPPDVPANDRARGRVYDGLDPGRPGTLCAGLYEVRNERANAGIACTHGPDDPPAEANVAAAVAPMSPSAIASAPPIACPPGDDGVSGLRVQAIYAYEQGQTNRYAQFATSFPAYAGNVEWTYAQSAAQTGGVRHVRWVTDAQCDLDVRVVSLPAGSLANLGSTRDALKAKGFDSADRKYLVWADASVYCGIGYIYGDDSPQGDGSTNANDGKYAMYARVDNGCWGLQNSVEAHELMHNLGGVQASAPHATSGSHCVDNADRMCYNDGRLKSGQAMLTVCASTQERLLDCNHDDYYSTSPKAGSYLATHWNAAASRFLFSSAAAPPATSTSTTATGTATTTTTSAPSTATVAPSSSSNEWWVQAAVSPAPAKVEVKAGSGSWTVMDKQSYGHTKSLHAPKGTPVSYRVTDVAGRVLTTASHAFLVDMSPLTATSGDPGSGPTGPSGSSTTTTSRSTTTATTAFQASFSPKSIGNDWWVEAKVTSGKPIAKVEAKVGAGAWTALPTTSWGTHGKSLNAPNGSQVSFRAVDAAGAVASGPTVTWT